MGVVYKATDPVIGRTVAVKTIKLSAEGTGLTRPELLARFQTEARAAGLLTHPNIVVVFDAAKRMASTTLLWNSSKAAAFRRCSMTAIPSRCPRVLRIMEQACSALQFAHDAQRRASRHQARELMLTGDDTVKVTDFGTAKILQFALCSKPRT